MSPMQPIQLADFKVVYFDTSAWNFLSKHADRAELVRRIKHSGTIVLASAISVGEVLRTEDNALRQLICCTMRELHGDGLLLERPYDLAIAAAEAFRRCEKDMLLPRTGPGEALYSYMCNPASPPEDEIGDWLGNMDANLKRFIDDIRLNHQDPATHYCTRQVLERQEFLQLLCLLPPIKHLNVSISEMKQFYERCHVWSALGATLAYTIELSAAPEIEKGHKRPGAADTWQLAYLGVAEAFVTDDGRMREAARRVSSCMPAPRCVIPTGAFLKTLVAGPV